MNNIIKFTIITLTFAIVFGVFAFVSNTDSTGNLSFTSPATVFAWGSGDYGGGCCDYGGGGEEGGYGGNEPGSEPPICSAFNADRTTLPYGGGNVTFTWTSANASSASINNGVGSVPPNGSKTVHVTGSATYVLTVSGYGGSDTCSVPIKVKPAAKPATCDSFTASRTTVPYGGTNVRLTWNTTNATSVVIDHGVGAVAADGSKTVFVDANTTFTLTAKGAGGNDTCTVPVHVAPAKVATCDSFTASPSNLPYGGGNVTLTWNTTNANSVVINNGVGTVAADGSKTVYVQNDTTFTLTAQGTDGNDSCQATVHVGNAVSPHCDYLRASDNYVEEGDRVTLSWETTNADNVSINHGIGSVARDGSMNVTVYDDITYVLTAQNDGRQDSCSVTIHVENQPEHPRCDYFRVDDSSVEEGDRVTLEWGTTNADRVYIDNGIGYVDDNGSETVRVYNDETYELTVYNNGEEDTCRVHVNVDQHQAKTPRCELDVSDDRVNAGDTVTLEWNTDNADEITIEDDRGKEIFNSRSSRYFDGEIDVRVFEDTEFTLTVEGEDNRDRDCSVDVRVDKEDISIYQHRNQEPIVAGISFTQVPYTGFDAGPTLTAIFYSLLVLWALFIAYVLVIKRDSILGFRLRTANTAAYESTDDELKKKVMQLANRYNHLGW